jgi:predicted helicase
MRYGQHFIEKNGSGILAYINPHGFLDNPTFRGMRWHLLKTFDKIYTIDLHGNSKKKETAPDGSADINVFDIQQGVSINIFVKTGKKKANELGKVFHYDLYGKREMKYDFLSDNSLKSVDFKELKPEKPFLFFVPKNNEGQGEYETGFRVDDLFAKNNVGFVSANDGLNVSMTEQEQRNKINDILELDENQWRIKYNRPNDAQSWKYKWAKEDAEKNQTNKLTEVSYRPFDKRLSLYTGKSGGLYARPSYDIMQHFLKGENVGLALCKQFKTGDNYLHAYISKGIIESSYVSNRTSEITSIFPIYLYPDDKNKDLFAEGQERTPNLNMEIVNQIAKGLGLTFTNEKETTKDTFAPIDILDYIYAVLHSPTYREKYKEFLKIDFPRVPYPKDKDNFWKLVKLGREIREIHLLESATVEKYITQYSIDGNHVVGKIKFQDNKVYINDTQYFDNVPEVAWNFYIGGYQPAQKWLKDRKDRKLEFDDILHYQKIIVALTETDRLMKEVDKIEI